MSLTRRINYPWSLIERIHHSLRKTRGLLRGVIYGSEPSSTWQTVYPPVIGYTAGASGEMKKRGLVTYAAHSFYLTADEVKFASQSTAPINLEIARAFNRLGYVVDVVDWKDGSFMPMTHYDVLFGMGPNFKGWLPLLDDKTLKIYWGTGEYWAYDNAAVNARVAAFNARRRTKIPLQKKESCGEELADAVIVTANQVILDTYRKHNPRLSAIDNIALNILPPPDLDHRNFSVACKNFLWMGNDNFIRRGLDLVLDVFTQLPDLHLWVCGPLKSETERAFIRAYRRELFRTPNIHPIGWIDIHAEQFRRLMDSCGFAIYASCTEAMSGSILNCLGRGLIPLISRDVGLDTEDFGVTFRHDSVESIRRVVSDMANASPDVCRRMAREAYYQACTRYTLDSFSRNIERILRTILN